MSLSCFSHEYPTNKSCITDNYVCEDSYKYQENHKPICGGNLTDGRSRRYYFQVLEYEVFQLQ